MYNLNLLKISSKSLEPREEKPDPQHQMRHLAYKKPLPHQHQPVTHRHLIRGQLIPTNDRSLIHMAAFNLSDMIHIPTCEPMVCRCPESVENRKTWRIPWIFNLVLISWLFSELIRFTWTAKESSSQCRSLQMHFPVPESLDKPDKSTH